MSIPTASVASLRDACFQDILRCFGNIPDVVGNDFDMSLNEDYHHLSKLGAKRRADRLASVRLLDRLDAKCIDIIDPEADQRALELFLQFNERSAAFKPWINPSPVFWTVLGEVHSFLSNVLSDEHGFSVLSESRILDRLDTGPGAAIGANGNSFFEKIGLSSQVFSSSYVSAIYSDICNNSDHLLGRAQKNAFSMFGMPSVSDVANLHFVPKKSSISRTISVCPSGDILFQKGVQSILEDRLRQQGPWSIDLKTQQVKNRSLAQKGSLQSVEGDKDPFCTIDLSSASDCISVGLVRALLPRADYNMLSMFRPNKIRLPDGAVTNLGIFCTMGNAYCFPLQTLIFLSVVRAVYRLMDIPPVCPGEITYRVNDSGQAILGLKDPFQNFAVNGDDIIVRREAYNEVCRTLETMGFVVNKDKSFSYGRFRESCGGDYYCGHQVRSVYVKSLRSIWDRYTAFNLILRWGARHGVIMREALRYLYYSVPRADRLRVPPYEDFTAGFHFTSTFVRKPASYQCYVPDPISITLGMAPNPFFDDAVMACAIRGMLRDNKLAFRIPEGQAVCYQRITKKSPGWDFLGSPTPQFSGVGIADVDNQLRWSFT